MAIAFLFIPIIWGCKKEPLDHLTQDESRIYVTDHDSTVNFTNFKTFSVSDSLAVIENGKKRMELNDVDGAFIQAVKDQMEAKGYTLVTRDQNPDVGLTVNKIISTVTGVISTSSYWDIYSSFWDPYYWGYPGFSYYLPYSYAVYQINEGALSIDMVDLKNAEENKKLDVIWTGLIRGSGIYQEDLASSQVGALFDQSPYLTTEQNIE